VVRLSILWATSKMICDTSRNSQELTCEAKQGCEERENLRVNSENSECITQEVAD